MKAREEERAALPPDEQTERMVCAICLAYEPAIPIASRLVKPDDFENLQYRAVFKSILYCSLNGGVDEVAVANHLKDSGLINDTHSGERLQSLILEIATDAQTSSPGNVAGHCKRLRELSQRRKLSHVSGKIKQIAEIPSDNKDVFNQAMKVLENSYMHDEDLWPTLVQDSADKIIEDALTGEPREVWGLSTGFAEGAFDQLTGGIQPGQFWVFAGLPSMGKSTFITAMLRGFRANNPDAGNPLLISTEMDENAVARFAIAAAAGVHTLALVKRNLGDLQREAVKRVKEKRLLDGIYVMYSGGLHVDQLFNTAKLFKDKHGLPLLIVDVAAGLASTGNSEYDRVTYIVKKLNYLAKRLGICVIATCHLNRTIKEDKDRKYKPQLWHLRATGQWEQDADRIFFIHRPAYFGFDDPRTEIIQQKDRHFGQVSSVFVEYKKATGQFHKDSPPEDTDWPDQGQRQFNAQLDLPLQGDYE